MYTVNKTTNSKVSIEYIIKNHVTLKFTHVYYILDSVKTSTQHNKHVNINNKMSNERLTYFPVHFIATTDLIHKLPLESTDLWIELQRKRENVLVSYTIHSYISKLDFPYLPELPHTRVGGVRLEEQLGQGHLLRTKQRVRHFSCPLSTRKSK